MEMKTRYILAIGCTFIALFTRCNNDFMDRFPTTSVTDNNLRNSERDMELYCNGLYTYIKGHGVGHDQSPIVAGDNQSDNMVPQNYDKVAAGEHIVPENREIMNGTGNSFVNVIIFYHAIIEPV